MKKYIIFNKQVDFFGGVEYNNNRLFKRRRGYEDTSGG